MASATAEMEFLPFFCHGGMSPKITLEGDSEVINEPSFCSQAVELVRSEMNILL